MPLVPMRLLLDHAEENGYGIPAFNVYNLEQFHAILKAAHETDSPVIMQAYGSSVAEIGERFLSNMIRGAAESYPHLPIAFNLDHGNSPSACYRAMKLGFTSVMMDGSLEADSTTPSSYQYNVAVTAAVSEVAHTLGVSVEGALGYLGSLETGTAGKEGGVGFDGTLDPDQMVTNPDQAVDFVEQTKVDALAIAIGNNHGLHKFTRRSNNDMLLLDRIAEIHRRLPNTHLVMHGSSTVPEELVAIINEYGGNINKAYGAPVEEIQLCIKSGIRKINIDTDNKLAVMAAVRQSLAQSPQEFDPRHFLKTSVEFMQQLCINRYDKFGAAGHGSKIKPSSIEVFAVHYAKADNPALVSKTPIAA